MQSDVLSGGFQNPSHQSADAFRAAMHTMAMPGKIAQITGATGPAPLSQAASTLLLTLCDPETPLFLAPEYDIAPVRDWITFHTGAPFADAPHAMFALGTWAGLAPHHAFSVGTAEYPDRAATLIVEMPELQAAGVWLSGPGIQTQAQLNVPDIGFSQANARLYPLGVDLFLTHGIQIAALPRSTKVQPCM